MMILGLNAFHADSAAAIVRDGKLVAAAEEERFRRVKHWAGFPSQAIAYCLREAGVALSDISQVAVNQNSRTNLFRKLAYVATGRPDLKLLIRFPAQLGAMVSELRSSSMAGFISRTRSACSIRRLRNT